MLKRAYQLAGLACVSAIAIAWSVWGGRGLALHVLRAVASVRAFGALGPFAFLLIYVAAVVAFIPGSWLTVAGGAMFGVTQGVVYALVGATLGSTAAFLLARYVVRDSIARRAESMPRFAALDRAVAAQGARIVLLLRLSPVAPFNLLNYALGVTTIATRDFVIGSLGMIPATVVYAYAGAVAGDVLALAGKAPVPTGQPHYVLLAGGFIATAVAAFVVARAAHQALRDV